MSDEDPKPKKSRLWIHYAIAATITIGYASAWISRSACETKTARLLTGTVRPGKQFFVKPKDVKAGKLKVWNAVGANYRVYDSTRDGQNPFPWCSLGEVHPCLPFIVAAEYGWMKEGEWGGEGYFWYLAFFGLTVRVWDTVTTNY